LATGENITDHQSLSKPIQIFISTCIVSLLAIPSAPYLFRINPQRALPLNVIMGFRDSEDFAENFVPVLQGASHRVVQVIHHLVVTIQLKIKRILIKF